MVEQNLKQSVPIDAARNFRSGKKKVQKFLRFGKKVMRSFTPEQGVKFFDPIRSEHRWRTRAPKLKETPSDNS